MAGIHTPKAPDYSKNKFWFDYKEQYKGCSADIFYVYPTLDSAPKKNTEDVALYTDVNKKEERLQALKNQTYNKSVYAAENFNFFAPFYRQMTTKVFDMNNKDREKKAKISMSDVCKAFQYYMTNFNNGRPFILLGHSQGSQMLLELLKRGMSESQFKLLIAAYIMGYEITQRDLNKHPNRLKPAQSATDLGVVISYNSVTDLSAISPLLSNTVVCINPLNWSTEEKLISREQHKGVIRYSKKDSKYITYPNITSVQIQNHYLVCKDIDPYVCFKEEIKEPFPLGNLHFADTWLYAENIRENMVERKNVFLAQYENL